ncbi:fungal-specific transcription factor domain-containing protein [Cantharellus anzutake]|uniref:fungal-specific transcription factor domain-containing protein n=1 Tax=Cantharellus anzutake TaxID=1750568 RepID=UPI0019040F07|nr:fungal-specific transcription factor domain-containing protein [Cantharellus anzutake]KAF8328697.1 fungal-specific transcription factor domain-containing protein [Cantharellus anzutake]
MASRARTSTSPDGAKTRRRGDPYSRPSNPQNQSNVENPVGLFVKNQCDAELTHVEDAPFAPLVPYVPRWNRHLPDTDLDSSEHNSVLAAYFSLSCSWNMIVNPTCFVRDYAKALSQEIGEEVAHYSPMLHNAMLAFALAFSSNQAHQSVEFRRRFVTQAKVYVDTECQAPTLSTVQGLAILSCFHSGAAELVLSFTYLGMAMRVSQALNLENMKLGTRLNDIDYQRACVFWSLFSMDKCGSLYVGRPQTLAPSFEGPYQPPGTPPIDYGVDVGMECLQPPPSHVSGPPNIAFIWYIKVMRIIQLAMKMLYGKNGVCNPIVDIRHIEYISGQLERWKRDLPGSLRIDDKDPDLHVTPEVTMVNLMCEWMHILLYQPFYQDRSSIRYITTPVHQIGFSDQDYTRVSQQRERAYQTATPAAERILFLLEKFDSEHGLDKMDNASVQIAYVAGKIHYLGIIDSTSAVHRSMSSKDGMEKAIQLLRRMGSIWGSAVASANRLEELFTTASGNALGENSAS